MTADDDAFLRTVVDNPGHDVPRLVYADWLDDRDDPRGPFLRAEVEWARPWKEGIRPGDADELLELADDLDPLWVARVSRPPLGVCCDHVGISRREETPSVTAQELKRLEQDVGIELPTDYFAFLLNQNGGTLARCRVSVCRRIETDNDNEASEEESDDDVWPDYDDEAESEPSYREVGAGRAEIVIQFYPLDLSYREQPADEWEETLKIRVEESGNPAAIIQADLYKYIEIGANAGAIPGVYRLVLEDYEANEDLEQFIGSRWNDTGGISHHPTRSTRRYHYSRPSLAEFLGSLIPLQRANRK